MNEPLFEIKEDLTREEGQKVQNYGKFVISPLEQGYGDTLGNCLRRVLLGSLPGFAITSVRISGVKHQFSTIKGMRQDVVEFLLNLKKVKFSANSDKPIKATLEAKTAGEVFARDIKVPADVKVANPEAVLATLAKGTKLEAEMLIEKGVGYSPEEDREKEEVIGLIPLDASFSPVMRVNYKIEETRVGRLTNYDKLIFEVWTDGTIKPKDAITQGAEVLVSYFNQIVSPKKVEAKKVSEVDTLGIAGKLSVEEIGLPTRVSNALAKAGYETVEDLVKAKRQDLVSVRNLGEKSLKIIAAALGQKGVAFNV